MTHSCSFGPGCCLVSLGLFVIWWLLASSLLWFTWNRVVAELFKVKEAKWWQALVLIATVMVLAAPCCMMRNRSMRGCCPIHDSMNKEDCPYAKAGSEAPAETPKPQQ